MSTLRQEEAQNGNVTAQAVDRALNAAVQCFHDEGVNNTNLEDVLQAAHMVRSD